MNTSVAIRTNDNEVVTRGILREVLEGGVEKKIDSVGVRLEDMNEKLVFIYKRFDSLDEQVYTLTYELRIEYPKYVQLMFDDMREEMNVRFGAMEARITSLEKRIDELEQSKGLNMQEFYREMVDIIKMNQQLVDELAIANDALRIELSRLPSRIEDLISRIVLICWMKNTYLKRLV